jgi:hypothetical protein
VRCDADAVNVQRDPMFVSDAMPKDIYQLIDALEEAAKVPH